MARNSKGFEGARKVVRDAGLYIVKEDEYDRMLDIASMYYVTDKLLIWLCNGVYDPKVFKHIIRGMIKSTPDSLIYADSPDMNAIAFWMPPDASRISLLAFFKHGGSELLKSRGVMFFLRLINYELYATRLRKRQTGGKDWFLFMYTVKNANSGMGYGEKMLMPITEFAWGRGEACYSEVNTDDGIAMLKQAGFQVREQGKVPGSNVNHYGVLV